MTVHPIIFDDEITIWWQRQAGDEKKTFCIFCNGEKIGKTKKTYFTIKGLLAQKEYRISVDDNDEVVLKTKKIKRKIDVTSFPYMANGDGKTLNTQAIQNAINDCGADDFIYFPSGVYLSGALNLHSDMEIYLDSGAILQGTSKAEDYLPKIKSRFEGIERDCYRSLLNMGSLDHNAGYNCGNVIIRGGGVISGGGKELCLDIIEKERKNLKKYFEENADYVKTCENSDTIPGRARGRLVNLSNCKDVIFSNITFKNGPAWNLHFIYSKNIVTYGCKIISHDIFNGDGWDPDSSENCVIFNTVFDTSDDCIAIKSGKNPEGNRINRVCKNIFIFDCYAINGHGFSIGSEISGGVENVYIWDCNLVKAWHGLQIKGTCKRGGYVKNIHVQNCIVPCILVWEVGYNDDGESAGHPPVFSDYYFENITVSGNEYEGKTRYIYLHGFEEAGYEVKNVIFKNLIASNAEQSEILQKRYAKNIVWENS